MKMQHEQRMMRLGLLLAGGGAKVRRVAAGAENWDSFAGLREQGLPSAMATASETTTTSAAPELVRKVESRGWRWLTPEDSEYPELLSHTADPPLGLFVCGRLSSRPAVSVVGSRRPTAYGVRAARLIAESAAKAGAVVVSGMARGIDGAAHEGALAANGETWAVWGSGPDTIYPREHAKLAEKISERGALITEYPPGTPPRKHHFPERNRIVAGLVRIVVVVEAAARSGALNTARQALDEDREVMAVPGSIFSELSVGPNALLRLGAQPLTTPKDLVESLDLPWAEQSPGDLQPHPLDGILGEEEILAVDLLAARIGKPVEQVLAYIVQLEVEGWIKQDSSGRFHRAQRTEK